MIAYIDGGSRGNPGPAGFGVCFSEEGDTSDRPREICQFIGIATNNQAEYRALVFALEEAIARRATSLMICSDSLLLVQQMRGKFRVKSGNIRPLWEEARRLADQIGAVGYEHIPREENSRADALANKAMDQGR